MVNNAYNKNGATMVGGKKYQLTVGSRAQVWNGTAYKTGYGKKGLKRSDLIRNKHGRIVSKKKLETAKREKRLEKHGYFAEKGKFGAVRKTAKRSSKRKALTLGGTRHKKH